MKALINQKLLIKFQYITEGFDRKENIILNIDEVIILFNLLRHFAKRLEQRLTLDSAQLHVHAGYFGYVSKFLQKLDGLLNIAPANFGSLGI